MKAESCVIFLNGNSPKREIAEVYIKKAKHIVCADGGANKAFGLKIMPEIVLGDLDSIKQSVLDHYKKKGVQIKKIPEQEMTDFEKALLYCISKKYKDVLVFGAISSRLDHSMNNFCVMKRYYKKLNLTLIDNKFEIFFINKKISFPYKKNSLVSLIPFPAAKGIKTMGLKFPLYNEDLELGVREGTLNSSDEDIVSISFRQGDLLLFKKHFI